MMPTVCLRTTHILYPSRALLTNMLLRHREPKRDEARLSPLREAGRQAGRAMAQEGDGVLQEASWLFSIFSVKEQNLGSFTSHSKRKRRILWENWNLWSSSTVLGKKRYSEPLVIKKKMIKGSTINKKIDKNGKNRVTKDLISL